MCIYSIAGSATRVLDDPDDPDDEGFKIRMEPDWSLCDQHNRLLVVMEVAISQTEDNVIAKAKKWLLGSSDIRAVIIVTLKERPRYTSPTDWSGIPSSRSRFRNALDDTRIGESIVIDGHTWFGTCTKISFVIMYRAAYFVLPQNLQQNWLPGRPPTTYTGPPVELRHIPYRSEADVESGDAEPDNTFQQATGDFEMRSAAGGFERMADVTLALRQVSRIISLCCCDEDDDSFFLQWEHVRAVAWTGAKDLAMARWEARPKKIRAASVRKGKGQHERRKDDEGKPKHHQRKRVPPKLAVNKGRVGRKATSK